MHFAGKVQPNRLRAFLSPTRALVFRSLALDIPAYTPTQLAMQLSPSTSVQSNRLMDVRFWAQMVL